VCNFFFTSIILLVTTKTALILINWYLFKRNKIWCANYFLTTITYSRYLKYLLSSTILVSSLIVWFPTNFVIYLQPPPRPPRPSPTPRPTCAYFSTCMHRRGSSRLANLNETSEKLHRGWEETKTTKVYFPSKRSGSCCLSWLFQLWETKLILNTDCLLAQSHGFIRNRCFFSF